MRLLLLCFFFFFNDTATTEIYTLSLHDALPICSENPLPEAFPVEDGSQPSQNRSEEHTSELQSLAYLVCRLLLEKKKFTLYSKKKSNPTQPQTITYKPHFYN